MEAFEHFYRGGAAISRLRGGPARGERSPEEWLASVTPRSGAAPLGLSALPDGSLLRDAVAADPVAWLGPTHYARFGSDTGVLVKLLDAGERLPVHVHPSRDFARSHLSCPYGKTEAWVVIEAEPGAVVHLGFRDPVGRAELAELVERQDSDRLLELMHEVPVRAGDTVLVPAGLPHAIGAGVFLLEVQEPTDFSILLEWDGFALDGHAEGHLGLGFDRALDAVDRGPLPHDQLKALHREAAMRAEAADQPRELLPEAAAPYFRAELVRPATRATIPSGFAVLTLLEGQGRLGTSHGAELAVAGGDVLVLPHAAGPLWLDGDVVAVVCRPAEPQHAERTSTAVSASLMS
ncbi:class I mannose-6-phosphate isomerase [Salinactinospora qingdaonensis]|uniref:Class I mannose-6-phosphate isomerase n=1 Tax=Salinactinospora qingdaonensis TaxID=702744 RepID=A0ABP7FBB0_9ACTN